MDQRGQFTFYASIFESAKRIRNKNARADFYDAVCDYALNGIDPDLDKLSDAAAIGFISAKPNLDASRKKAKSGKAGGSAKQTASKTEANTKQTAREKEIEKEKEIEIEIEDECHARAEGFDSFWIRFPNQVGKEGAFAVWSSIPCSDYPLVMDGLSRWIRSVEWNRENGRFVPRPARWLSEKRWEDYPKEVLPKGASGELGQAEIEAIERMLREV